MVRRTKDGFIRFSSFNDVSRALTSFAPNIITAEVDNLLSSSKNKVNALLAAQDYLEEIIYMTSMTLSSCYSQIVVASVPETANIATIRSELYERVRSYTARYNACDQQLTALASIAANKGKLELPKQLDKLLKSCNAESSSSNWGYVTLSIKNKKPINVLCHITKLHGVECASEEDKSNVYRSDKLVGVFFTNKGSKANLFYDDIVARGKATLRSLSQIDVNSKDGFKRCLSDFSLKVA